MLHDCIVYATISAVYHVWYTGKGVCIIERLAQVRRARGMSQLALAKASGVHRVTIARIECGTTSPKAETLKRLADCLGVLVDELIGTGG